MKILLVSDNRSRENLVPYPLGISCIASAARRAGHEVAGLDLMFAADARGEAAAAVRRFQPDVIGLSVRNIDNQDMRRTVFYPPELRGVVDAIGSETDAPVVLGGAGFTIFPLECLEYFGLELGVVGEGEVTFVRLLELLSAGADPCDLPGVAVRRSGEKRLNPPAPFSVPGELPLPDRRTFDAALYNWAPGRAGVPFVANAQARRGCHMRCIYCSSPLVEGRRMRLREPRSVADELHALEEQGIGFLSFTDSLFNYPADYSRALCVEIASRNLSLEWTCSFTPLNADLELLGLMRQAGCVMLSIGNESGSDDMLAALRKGFSRDDVIRSVAEAHALGMRVNCFLLLGGPGETRRTVAESIDLLDVLAPQQVGVTVGIRIYPGCELHRISVDEGVVAPGQDLLQPTFYLSPGVEPWLYDHMLSACAAREGWVL